MFQWKYGMISPIIDINNVLFLVVCFVVHDNWDHHDIVVVYVPKCLSKALNLKASSSCNQYL